LRDLSAQASVAGSIIDILVPDALGRWSRSHGGKSESFDDGGKLVDGLLQLLDEPKKAGRRRAEMSVVAIPC
jgi:hypothetical protein